MNLTEKQIAKWIEQAKVLSFSKQTKWSAARSLVLENLLQQKAPLTAYELLTKISENSNKAILPASLYRILDSFCSLGIALRIDSTKSFVANDKLGEQSNFLIVCTECGNTHAVYSRKLKSLLEQTLYEEGFMIERKIVELSGKCISCLPLKHH